MTTIASKINVLRALSSVIARRAIRLCSIIVSLVLVLSIIGIWMLAHFLSIWWWLLLIIYLPLLIVVIVVYVFTRFITWRIYPAALSREQTRHLRDFSDKIMHVLETRGLSWGWFATICIKDLLIYRELRTLKTLLADTTSLRSDFSNLEKELS